MAAVAATSGVASKHSHQHLNNDDDHDDCTPTKKKMSTIARFNLERDNIGVVLNTVSACLLLAGGCIGYMTKGSKASIVVSFLFAMSWIFCVHLHVKNTGRNIEQRLIKIQKRSQAAALFMGMYQDTIEEAQKTVWRAYTGISISALALMALMGMRVVIMKVAISTPIVATMATGGIVFLFNLQRLLVSAQH